MDIRNRYKLHDEIAFAGQTLRSGVGYAFPGPDALAPTDRLMTWTRDEAVKITVEDKGPRAAKPVSVPTAFASTVNRVPDHTAIGK